jgi:hypothetical protein
VSVRPRRGRWCLVLAYTLATVLVQGAHRHGRQEDEGPTRCLASCEGPGVRLSGHSAPDLDHLRNDCPACQFRANHHAGPLASPSPLLRATVAAAPELPPPTFRRLADLRPACRAPPRA